MKELAVYIQSQFELYIMLPTLRQATLHGVWYTAMSGLILALTLLTLCLLHREGKRSMGDMVPTQIFVIIIGVLCFTGVAQQAYYALANPEYWALEHLPRIFTRP